MAYAHRLLDILGVLMLVELLLLGLCLALEVWLPEPPDGEPPWR